MKSLNTFLNSFIKSSFDFLCIYSVVENVHLIMDELLGEEAIAGGEILSE
jgi:hypothetical protein